MKFLYKYLVGISLFSVCCFIISPSFASTPMETMKKSVGAILDVLDRGDTSDDSVWQKQRDEVSGIVALHFDLREMAKRSLAKYWKRRTPDEQDEFAKLFAELIKNTYIERLRSFSGSKDGTKFDKEIVRGTKSAVSSVVWQNGKEITVVYKLYRKGNAWLVYDVIIENVSLVRNYRSQFAQVIQKDGYEALVRKIQKNLASPPVIGEHARLGE